MSHCCNVCIVKYTVTPIVRFFYFNFKESYFKHSTKYHEKHTGRHAYCILNIVLHTKYYEKHTGRHAYYILNKAVHTKYHGKHTRRHAYCPTDDPGWLDRDTKLPWSLTGPPLWTKSVAGRVEDWQFNNGCESRVTVNKARFSTAHAIITASQNRLCVLFFFFFPISPPLSLFYVSFFLFSSSFSFSLFFFLSLLLLLVLACTSAPKIPCNEDVALKARLPEKVWGTQKGSEKLKANCLVKI